MFSRTFSASLLGVEAKLVRVEAHLAKGIASFRMAGLPAKTVREAERRVKAALSHCGHQLPVGSITVNLAPADLPKDGAALDLAIALALLQLDRNAPREAASRLMLLGELALDGTLRPVRGVLASADCARGEGLETVVVPEENATEAMAITGIETWGARTLPHAVALFTGQSQPATNREPQRRPSTTGVPDLNDVRGQAAARRALEIAASGGHNLLLTGPPGTGKSMLARRMPGILPPLEEREAIESTKVHSAAGLLPPGSGLLHTRPFRAPHHTVSYAGLLGGGAVPRPGEISLAHNGVLYLDEMPEFHRTCLEGLRQPLESGEIWIARGNARAFFPCRFLLVGSMNPCRCGFHGDPQRVCRCTPNQIEQYRSRISGPLLDRFDLIVEVPAVPMDDLRGSEPGTPTAAVLDRVLEAREFSQHRYTGHGIRANAELDVAALDTFALPSTEAETMLRTASERLHLSARAVHRVLRVARTIADFNRNERIQTQEVAEALQFRSLETGP